MKRQLLMTVAMGLALLLPAPAFACTAVPAKAWKGAIQFATPLQSVSSAAFLNTGCEWANPALNGFDAIVFDVTSHRGLQGNLTWNTDAPTDPDTVFVYFRTASCAAIPNTTSSQNTSGQAHSVALPSTAKWLIAVPTTLTPSHDIDVTVTSPGRKCP